MLICLFAVNAPLLAKMVSCSVMNAFIWLMKMIVPLMILIKICCPIGYTGRSKNYGKNKTTDFAM